MPYRWMSDLAKSLMSTPNTTSPEQAVAHLIDQKLQLLGVIKPPINLELIASTCDIQPNFITTNMKEDGRLVRRDGKWYVYLNQTHNTSRQRFSAAHEITHKIIRRHQIEAFSCRMIGQYARKHEEEWLCDFGASHLLLLQKQFLMPIISDIGYGFRSVEHISSNFGTSFEAAAQATARICSQAVAITYFALGHTKDERMKLQQPALFPNFVEIPIPKMRLIKKYTSIGFPINLPINKSVPERSVIHQALTCNDTIYGVEELSFDERPAIGSQGRNGQRISHGSHRGVGRAAPRRCGGAACGRLRP